MQEKMYHLLCLCSLLVDVFYFYRNWREQNSCSDQHKIPFSVFFTSLLSTIDFSCFFLLFKKKELERDFLFIFIHRIWKQNETKHPEWEARSEILSLMNNWAHKIAISPMANTCSVKANSARWAIKNKFITLKQESQFAYERRQYCSGCIQFEAFVFPSCTGDTQFILFGFFISYLVGMLRQVSWLQMHFAVLYKLYRKNFFLSLLVLKRWTQICLQVWKSSGNLNWKNLLVQFCEIYNFHKLNSTWESNILC